MGDVQREMLGDPYADLHDVDSYPVLLAEAEACLADLRQIKSRGGDSGCPWMTVDQAITETETTVRSLKGKIEAGILTAVQDRAMYLEGF